VEYKVVNANILEWAKEYKGQKFHAILCDPPYGLEFMGKKWDSFSDSTNSALGGQSPRNKIPGTPFKRRGKPISGWCEKDRLMAKKNYYEFSLNWALAIKEHLLPGAYLLVFGGTRTFHRLACALEDAGFEMRDTIMCWAYGQGFPKSLNVSKQLEGIYGKQSKAFNTAGKGDRPDIQEPIGPNKQFRSDYGYKFEPTSDAAKTWDGYGTALKPAIEPLIVARKPIEGTVAENCLKYGSGVLNIDGGRIKGTVSSNPIVRNAKGFESVGLIQGETGKGVVSHGRWPSNLILQHSPECVLNGTKKHKSLGYTKPDGTETVEDWDCVEGCPVRKLDEQSGELKSGQLLSYHKRTGDSIIGTFKIRDRSDEEKNFGGDSGGASRFFYNVDWSNEIEERLGIADPVRYCAKASRAERDAGCGIGSGNIRNNTHPTVKPINLIRYLATLLLPPKECAPRRILVPFAGSGSELIGAMQAGWDEIVGVEREKEYCELAETRLAYWKNRRPTDPNSKKKTKQEKVDKEQLTLL